MSRLREILEERGELPSFEQLETLKLAPVPGDRSPLGGKLSPANSVRLRCARCSVDRKPEEVRAVLNARPWTYLCEPRLVTLAGRTL